MLTLPYQVQFTIWRLITAKILGVDLDLVRFWFD